MMQAVVTGGTGRRADSRDQWAGKTGTPRLGTPLYDAWFIFFAPADNPVVAGAVVVEHSAAASAAPSPPRSPNSLCRRSFRPRRTLYPAP